MVRILTCLTTIIMFSGCSTPGQSPTVFEQYMIKRASNPAVYRESISEYKTITCRTNGNIIHCTEW
jgi:uncharacterized lipoprotein YajG